MTTWLKKQVEYLSVWITFVLLLAAAGAGYNDIVQRLARIEVRTEISDQRQRAMEQKLDDLARPIRWQDEGSEQGASK